MKSENVVDVPLWKKWTLTLQEAAQYFNIGQGSIRKITDDPNCDCVLFVGRRRLIKRVKFEEFLDKQYSI